jgi:hypothetical protein
MACDHDENRCPLAAVDQRLDDLHRLWHQAADAYFDPDAFRVAIQTTRSVTFILQKNKAIIPDFDRLVEVRGTQQAHHIVIVLLWRLDVPSVRSMMWARSVIGNSIRFVRRCEQIGLARRLSPSPAAGG